MIGNPALWSCVGVLCWTSRCKVWLNHCRGMCLQQNNRQMIRSWPSGDHEAIERWLGIQKAQRQVFLGAKCRRKPVASFPRKMANVEKMFARESTLWEARLPYPTQTGGHQVCITRKGDPALRLLTNRSRKTHLFASSAFSTEPLASDCGRTDDWEHRARQALGILSWYQHKMLHNNAAKQRPGEKPASAPEASQITPRAQGRANLKIPTLKRTRSRPEDTNAASLTDGNMDTHIIHVQGAPSPPLRLDLTTPAK